MTANRSNPESAHHSGTTLSDVTWVLPTDIEELEDVAQEVLTPDGTLDGRNAFVGGEGEKYRPAVEYWASVVGGPVPWPNDANKRLRPEFVEWMFALPIGYTAVGISRAARLRCLGNMVMPAAAALAWSLLEEVAP